MPYLCYMLREEGQVKKKIRENGDELLSALHKGIQFKDTKQLRWPNKAVGAGFFFFLE